jgi:hypothetical protein
MRNDPCRRFSYGVTIEDCNMRVWFVSRGVASVTPSFGFMTVRASHSSPHTSLTASLDRTIEKWFKCFHPLFLQRE